MPHIVIEYSDNLHSQIKESAITKAVHQTVLNSALFSPDAIKARSIGYSDYVLPDNAQSFIHITVSILNGRNTGQKAALSNAVFDAAKNCIPHCDKLSVDIHDMNVDTYRK